MNLVEKLLKIDRGELEKLPTAEVAAKRMSEIMGEEVTVTVSALSGKRYMELTSGMINKKGEAVFDKLYEVNAHVAAEGVVFPDLRDANLQSHFGCATPKDLAVLLFPGGELTEIAGKITELSGFSKDGSMEEEIKN